MTQAKLIATLVGFNLIFLNSCNIGNNPITDQIPPFEKKYKKTLDGFTDSLRRNKNLPASYKVEFKPGYMHKVDFINIDSLNQPQNYLDVEQALNTPQKDFFIETSTRSIFYYKSCDCFVLSPFSFEDQDSTVVLVIKGEQSSRNFPQFQSFRQMRTEKNYTYLVGPSTDSLNFH